MIALTIPRALTAGVRECCRAAGMTLAAWRRRIREREELARMSENELRDARMTPYEARREIHKPFWRA